MARQQREAVSRQRRRGRVAQPTRSTHRRQIKNKTPNGDAAPKKLVRPSAAENRKRQILDREVRILTIGALNPAHGSFIVGLVQHHVAYGPLPFFHRLADPTRIDTRGPIH